MAQPDYRHTTTNIDVQFHPHGIRAWLSCVLDDGKMLLLATDRVTHQEICRQIQQQLNRMIQIPPRRNSRPEGSGLLKGVRRRSR
jgi:hypothetical protein